MPDANVEKVMREAMAAPKDQCDACRRPYENREKTWVGTDEAGATLQVGPCCLDRLKLVMGGSIYFTPGSALTTEIDRQTAKKTDLRINTADTAWSRSDRGWFARHPNRAYRVRPSFPDEWPDDRDNCQYSAVWQVEPGSRMRKPLAVIDELLKNPTEVVARAIYEFADAAEPGKVTAINTEDVLAHAQILVRTEFHTGGGKTRSHRGFK
jgi:hypothetical protein